MRTHTPRHLIAAAALAALALLPALAAAEPTPTPADTPRGPLVIYLQNGFGAPTGFFGASVGYELKADLAVETGFGIGASGWQLPLMLRWYTPLLDRSGPPGEYLAAFSLAAGPSVALLSQRLGLNVPHDEGRDVDTRALYVASWLNVEAAWEVRGSWGGAFRVALGGGPRLFENMAGLCSEVDVPEGERVPVSDCDPPHFASGPRIANAPFILYLNLGYGWEFGR